MNTCLFFLPLDRNHFPDFDTLIDGALQSVYI